MGKKRGYAIKVLTIRVPADLHEDLKLRAHDAHTSLNEYCTSLLRKPVKPENYLTAGASPIDVDPPTHW